MVKSIEILELHKNDVFMALNLSHINKEQCQIIVTKVFYYANTRMLEIEKDSLDSIEILSIPYYEFTKYFKVLTIENVGV